MSQQVSQCKFHFHKSGDNFAILFFLSYCFVDHL